MKNILLAALFFFACSAAQASQNATQLPTASPYPGLTMLLNINSAFNTFQTNFSGASAPSSPTSYQWWTDTTTGLLKFYDGTNWLPVAQYSGSQWTAISNGVIGTIPASTGSSNAYVVTYSPVPTAYVTGQHYPFIANFQSTSTATENVNSLGAKSIKKQGGTSIGNGDIVNGAVVDTVYDGTNLQMLSQLGNSASGTVTSVATSGILTGGTITTSGTLHGASQSDTSVLSNISGSSAEPTGNTFTAVLDYVLGSTQGGVAYRGASAWSATSVGTNGQPLLSGGPSSNPAFGKLSVGGISASGTPSSSNYLRGDGSWQPAGGLSSCTNVTVAGSGITQNYVISCASGYIVTGGGCRTTVNAAGIQYNSYPASSTSWECDFINANVSGITAFAVCCH